MKTNERNRFVPCRNLSPNYLNKKRGMIHVFSFLLMMLFVVTGCSNDEEFITGDELLRANNITDVTHLFFQEKQEDGRTFYYGIRKGKDWFALFDNTEVLREEWYGRDKVYESSGSIMLDSGSMLKEFDNGEFIFTFTGQLIRLTDNRNVEYGATFDDARIDRVLTENLYLVIDEYNMPSWNIYDFEGNMIVNGVYPPSTSPYLYAGFKNNKVWIGYEDENKIWQEAIGLENFERNRSIHLGYGEYRNIYVEAIITGDFLVTNWGLAFKPEYYFHYYESGNEMMYPGSLDIVFLCKGNEIIYYPCEEVSGGLRNWYDGTVLNGGKEVISSNGKLLTHFVESVENAAEPVSLTDGIHFNYSVYESDRKNCRFYRINYQNGMVVWSTMVPQMADVVQSDSRITVILLEKGETVWKYNCDVINKDGSQYSFDFNLNIETGEIN